MSDKRLGIVVGGGPAPGINAVIGAATIEAVNQGFEVTGFYDGFKWLSSKSFVHETHSTPLDIPRVARIHFDGGSLLRTSRTSLMDDATVAEGGAVKPNPEKVSRVRGNLKELGISDLITIGGDDTALSSRFVAEAAGGTLRTVHVPKTIDNDLPLPHDIPTFGFSTARYNGSLIVKNLMQDSLTTGRWYLVTVMGRTAGWLALAVGQAASATVTLIPEEFHGKTTIRDIVDVLEGAMLKRRAMGRPDGVALVAEGLANRLGDRAELEAILGKELPVDAAGHIRLAEIPLGYLLRKELESRFAARGEKISMVSHMLGYELRSADPTPADMAYCRSLGHGCIRLLLAQRDEPANGEMVTMVNGNLVPMKFQDMVDPKTNRIRVRTVDTKSDQYRVARAYMIRLEQRDLDDPTMLGKLALHAGLTPDAFRERYHHAASQFTDGHAT